MKSQSSKVTGWGNTAPGVTDLVELEDFQFSDNSLNPPFIARGCGRSYGDAAYTSGGTTIQVRNRKNSELDSRSKIVRADSGVTIEELISKYLPEGLFVPVTPGTRFVTVGGAIAADIHGKNHHRHGTFGKSIKAMTIQTPVGIQETSGQVNQDLHWATIGGMGLTGLIAQAEIQMIPVETSKMLVNTYRVPNIFELLKKMKELDETYTYSVAWIDTLAWGDSLGRSVLTVGEHAALSDLPPSFQVEPLAISQSQKLRMPSRIPSQILNKLSVSLFNELWYRKAPKFREGEIQGISKFFHPLDGVKGWNSIYGKAGFIQYQFVIPDNSEDFIVSALSRFSKNGCPIFLAVLKRFGASNPGHLSFPISGWTLAVDVATQFPNLKTLLDELDKELISLGGRIYLAKDSRASAKSVSQMYPRLDEFRQVKVKFDPESKMKSNLSRRLGI